MLDRLAQILSRVTAALAGAVLVAITAYTLIEISLRATTGYASNVLVEFVGYGLAAMTLLGAAQAMRDGSLVRVSIFLHFAPAVLRRALDAFCLLCGIAVITFTAWFFWVDIQRSFLRGYETDSLVPLPSWLPPLGLFIGMLTFILEMATRLIAVVSGKGQLPEQAPEV